MNTEPDAPKRGRNLTKTEGWTTRPDRSAHREPGRHEYGINRGLGMTGRGPSLGRFFVDDKARSPVGAEKSAFLGRSQDDFGSKPLLRRNEAILRRWAAGRVDRRVWAG